MRVTDRISAAKVAARCIGILGLTCAALLSFGVGNSSGSTGNALVVTRFDDPAPDRCKHSDCSLREAVIAANAARRRGFSEIVLPRKDRSYELSIRNRPSHPNENASLTGDLDVKVRIKFRRAVPIAPGTSRVTIQGNQIDRVLDVRPTGSLRMKRVTITGGQTPAPHRSRAGGGIRAFGPIDLSDTYVTHSRAGLGAGIAAYGRIEISGGSVSGNHSGGSAGGIYSRGGQFGISGTKVSNNTAVGSGGGILLEPRGFQLASISASTISRNFAREGGGGIDDRDSNLTIEASTIAQNRTNQSGGGISVSNSGQRLQLNSSTVARNVANSDDVADDGVGAGIAIGSGPVGLTNSLLAENLTGGEQDQCSGIFDSRGGNLIGENANPCAGFGANDLTDVANPLIGTLGDFGGDTETIPLLDGSPAIGNAVPRDLWSVDQRGHFLDDDPDTGAYEH